VAETSLERLIEPIVKEMNCVLWGIEQISHGRQSTLKVYIDSDNGVDVDDCARVSRQISSLLDVEDLISGSYTLEVSSPGLERRLFKAEHFERFKGAMIKLSLRSSFEGRRRFRGILCGLEDKQVVLRMGEEEVLLPVEGIERANIIGEID
jgi:ribosome maturation factor RimP